MEIKYPLLYDESWLRQKYEIEGLSQRAVAKLAGCEATNSIAHALKKFNIEIRSETPKIYKSKYSLLNDPEWLYQKYVIEKLSINFLAELVGVKTPNSVRQALKRHNISVRNVSEGLTINRPDEGFVINHEVLDGTLLGDAGLRVWNPESNISNPHFFKRNKFKDHVEFLAKELFPETWESKVEAEWNSKFLCWNYIVRSYSYIELKPYFKRWYPEANNFKKIIPSDICINPKSLLHWFLDDGSSYHRRKESATKQIVITFSTECFSKENQEMLASKLYDKYGFRFRVGTTNSGTGYRMVLAQSQTALFYEIIGPPVTSLSYKWK